MVTGEWTGDPRMFGYNSIIVIWTSQFVKAQKVNY